MTTRTEAIASLLPSLSTAELADVATRAIGVLDSAGFARAGLALFLRLGELAKVDPVEAGRLAAALYAHLGPIAPSAAQPGILEKHLNRRPADDGGPIDFVAWLARDCERLRRGARRR